MGFSQFENIITPSERKGSLWKDEKNGGSFVRITKRSFQRHDPKRRINPNGSNKMLIFPTTLPETNIAPTNGWLENNFPIGEAYFRGLCQFQGGYFTPKTTSNQITKVGFLKDNRIPFNHPMVVKTYRSNVSLSMKRMVSRLCRKETFILYIYLSIFYHVRFPGGCYSLNPNSNPQNSIHFGSQAIEKHFHLFVLPHLSESTFLDVSTSIHKPASQSV